MRILHFADLHIGVETYSVPDPETGLSSRFLDFLRALDQVVDFALHSDVDMVLFCGDAYRSRNPEQTQQREFAARIARLLRHGIPVFLLVGNHDLPNAVGRATALDIFEALKISDLVTVGSRLDTHRVQTRRGTLQVIALPWAKRSALLAREEMKNLTYEEVNRRLEEHLTNALRAQLQALDPGLPAVLAGHVALSGAQAGSERTMTVGRDYLLHLSDVALPPLDYVALGHIHRTQSFQATMPVVYSGSLQRIDFGEEGHDKGFYTLDLDPSRRPGLRAAALDFHPVQSRDFLTIKVEVPPHEEDPTTFALRDIARYHVKDAIVRVQAKLSQAQSELLRDNDLRKALKDAHYTASIVREVDRKQSLRSARVPGIEGLSPLDALKSYLGARGTSPADLAALLERGRRLMQGIE